AGEEAAFAPFVIVSPGVEAGGEAAAQGEALCLESGERGGNVGRHEAERRGERGFGNGAKAFKAAAQDFNERFLGRPVLFFVPAGRGDRRVEMCVREQREELRQPLGGDPQLWRYSLSARLSPMGGGEGRGEVGDSGTFDRAHLTLPLPPKGRRGILVRQLQPCGALISSELGEPVAPTFTSRNFGGAEEAEPDEGVVEL